MKTTVKILDDRESLGIYAADLFLELSEKYIRQNGKFTVALAGGSTPKALYRNLVNLYAEDIHWSYIDFFWSDERYVAFDHPDSNGGMAYAHLLSPLGIAKQHYFPVPTSYKQPPQAAMEYEETIRHHFNAPTGIPTFDLIFLGMGGDGHTASLFPGSKALLETRRLVVANWVDALRSWRITFTYPLLNGGKHVIFLVSGSDKAAVIKGIHKDGLRHHPAAQVQPSHGELHWLIDASAGSEL
ncbi:6-phosphogluconolactonase [candidate division KSB1 bacterium]|nr:6-phosphogluconolactonase [candidate division KSB1 bacterium]RQW06322.1 MAG: 6-phosphogluconolactonase [candidate division KSB1 bacterium]